MTFRKHQKMSPPKAKCKQCGNETAMAGRADGLGKSCGFYKDSSVKKASEFAKAGK
jgi:hypothetical protein